MTRLTGRSAKDEDDKGDDKTEKAEADYLTINLVVVWTDEHEG